MGYACIWPTNERPAGGAAPRHYSKGTASPPPPPDPIEHPGARQSKRNEVVLPPLSGAGARDLIPTARPCRGRAVWPYHWYLPSDAPKA